MGMSSLWVDPRGLVAVLWLLMGIATVWGMCPSACNGHGTCTASNTCSCFPGYRGYDCFARECPTGAPWVGFAIADEDIRSTPRECSNMGRCSRDSGRCECEPGFNGPACERMIAPCNNNCNGHGRCLSLQDVGPMKNDYNLISTANYTAPWDADRVHGCVCDYGYTGADCSRRLCPFGDDPVTAGQADEIQALSCLCNGCTGSFTLSFRGQTTRPIAVTGETSVTLKAALEELLTIRLVSVTLTAGTGSPTTICSTNGVSALITFTLEHGDVPSLVVDTTRVSGTATIAVQADGAAATYGGTATLPGTKEWTQCSGRGLCNTHSGVCRCDSGFESSNGVGGQGDIADCGYRPVTLPMTSCPVNLGYPCSGHGTCSGTSLYRCSCDDSFSGYDCSRRRCALGRAWWEEPQVSNVAHMNLVECSNAGICDEVGMCRCFPGFEGVACDRLACPSRDGICSGRGSCMSARDLAPLLPTESYGTAGFVYGKEPNAVATWDADMIQGCYCGKVHWKRGQSVRYTGHDCSKVPCPRGDDPWTSNQVNEIQSFVCTAAGGSFKLTFRGETTTSIPASAAATVVEAALESLRTITSISVSYAVGVTTACTANGNCIQVTFHSPSGDVPALAVDVSSLLDSATAVASTEVVKGTTEDIVCNNRGRCDDDSGMCLCSLHHASSDGQGGYGVLDDCGVVDKFMTHGQL